MQSALKHSSPKWNFARRIGRLCSWPSLIFISPPILCQTLTTQRAQHRYYRHWPGQGSLPFSILVHRSWAPFLRHVEFKGRACRLDFRQSRMITWSTLFLHMTPGDDGFSDAFHEDVFDVAYLANSRPKRSSMVMAGDFNVDLLPTIVSDPFRDLPGRASRHEERRMLFRSHARRPQAAVTASRGIGRFPASGVGDSVFELSYHSSPHGCSTRFTFIAGLWGCHPRLCHEVFSLLDTISYRSCSNFHYMQHQMPIQSQLSEDYLDMLEQRPRSQMAKQSFERRDS